MRFYLDLNQSSLDWSKANVFEYKYIYYLARMIKERMADVGISLGGNTSYDNLYNFGAIIPATPFNFTDFNPHGLLTFHQLQMLYATMLYLATRAYLNPNNLSGSNWVNGDNRKFFGFSLQDLCEIANFDFFAHPFIPGERLDYYNQFLKPIHDCLNAFRYVWTNYFVRGPLYYKDINAPDLPTVQVQHDGETYTLPVNGQQRVEWWSNFDHMKDALESAPMSTYSGIDWDGTPCLGYLNTIRYERWRWKGYFDSHSSYSYYECPHWTHSRVFYKTTIKPMQRFVPGSPYEVKLLHSTNDIKINTVYYTEKKMHYFRSSYPNIVDGPTGSIPSSGFPIVEIEMFQNQNISDSLTNIPIEDFWYYNTQNDTTRINANVGMRDTMIGACYKPILIADYLNHFHLF